MVYTGSYMEQPINEPSIRGLDFTKEGQQMEKAEIIIPGVGVMSIGEAESLVSPGIIPGSNIEFKEDFTFERLDALRSEMNNYKGLFSQTEKNTYAGFIAELERRLLIKKALENFYINKKTTLH